MLNRFEWVVTVITAALLAFGGALANWTTREPATPFVVLTVGDQSIEHGIIAQAKADPTYRDHMLQVLTELPADADPGYDRQQVVTALQTLRTDPNAYPEYAAPAVVRSPAG